MIRWTNDILLSARPSDRRREPARVRASLPWFDARRWGRRQYERRTKPEDRFAMCQLDRFMMWIDAVGGYLVCLNDAILLGQPIERNGVDVPILGDLSHAHARIRRDGEGYLIEAIRDVRVDGRNVAGASPLVDGSLVQLGQKVKLKFRRPHPLSATARLDFASSHRTQPSADAVLLMADTCILGPKPTSHVLCRKWPGEVVLYRHGDSLFCRGPGDLEIDGGKHRQKGPVGRDSRISGEHFAICLEKI